MKTLPRKKHPVSYLDEDTIGKFRNDHPDTSRAAAVSVKSGTARRMVYEILEEYPKGLTDEQIIDLTGLPPSTARPRRIELVETGFVKNSGTRRYTKSRRQAIVWKVV